MRGKRLFIGLRAALAIFTVTLFVTSTRAAAQEKVLHSFGNGADGALSRAGLTLDGAGNLYGATYEGGTYGYGMVFELTPQAGGGWTEKVLHNFNNDGADGWSAQFSLVLDKNGNLYGTTDQGGAYGWGTVFELTRSPHAAGGGWTEKVLHSFGNGTDGSDPYAGLIIDAAGNLYGVTSNGGTYNYGTVFELTPTGGGWTEQVLYSFNNDGTDGIDPNSLIIDAVGNLYGTTWMGGAYYTCGGPPTGCGTVFEVTPQAGGGWTEKVLHSFGNGRDGFFPAPGLIIDAEGNLYGATEGGGAYGHSGTVFELTRRSHAVGGGWSEKVLHSFGNGTDGLEPAAGLIFDAAGNLYGTTAYGGTYGFGTVFELTPTGGGWTEQVLYSFNNDGTDGAIPVAGVIIDAAGNLYGTTEYGGTYNYGTAFEITP